MARTADAESYPKIRLKLLGAFELRSGEGSIALPMAAQRVVAFLGLQTQPLLRSYVAARIWFAGTDCEAQACMRSALWRLHRCTGGLPLIDATRTHLGLSPEVAVDVREQVSLAHGLLRCSVEFTDVDHGMLLDADLLTDWCDDWVLLERERLRQLRLHALEALAQRLTDCRRYGDAVEVAFAAVRADPLRDSAHTALIKAYLAEGNRVEAIREYRSYRQLLAGRLGLKPSTDIEAMMRELQMDFLSGRPSEAR